MFDQIISKYGASAKAKLSSPAITGAPEDNIRAPLEELITALAEPAGQQPGWVTLVGESNLSALGTRPDYAVTVRNALTGFIELKAPGKGADPRKFTDPHDKRQWQKLKSLPNLIYSDGQSFSLWQNGALVGQIIHLSGDLDTAGAKLTAPQTLVTLLTDFLSWSPIPPDSPRKLAEVSARLCRLLRDEVLEELENGTQSLTDLATEWRGLLFPQADDAQFADGYAQAVTFGLLMARAQDIPLDKGIAHAALALRDTNTLIGTALRLLTDDPQTQKALSTAISTLTRVLHEVHWPTLSKGKPDAWLYFYEDFLEVYDNALRKKTGSYYTPPEVVQAMVRLTDEALRDPTLFGRHEGLAAKDVTIADPATGTGTFLLGVLRKIAETVADDQGAGAVGPALGAAAHRLIGFELQFGPFAVAQLRLMAEMRALMGASAVGNGAGGNLPQPRLYVTDTLGDPYATQTQFSTMLAPIGNSRREANAIKRDEPITVVIGNPPYKEKAKGRGGWVEKGSDGRAAPMKHWDLPPAWGQGAHAKHLKNLYIFFWRWASWKVFAPDLLETTGQATDDRGGIVTYITVAGFLNGPGFEKMRMELRRDCSDIWVIDCTPEGHQPEVSTRIFQGVQHPVCIVLAARKKGKDRSTPSRLHVRQLTTGPRKNKFAELEAITLTGPGWANGPSDWRAPFMAEAKGEWAGFPALDALFEYNGSGVMPGRTWVIAPDAQSLADRWARLMREKDPKIKEALFYPHEGGDKTLSKSTKVGLAGHEFRGSAVEKDTVGPVKPIRYSLRSFDRQWIIPDNRLLNRPNPELWNVFSTSQIFLTSPEDRTPENGPALTVTGLLPDLHHYHGRGGRAFPLWRDAAASVPNVKAALLAHLTATYGKSVTAPDVMAYAAGLLAHPSFTARFKEDLIRPGLRVPITAGVSMFDRAVEIGRQVIWLHTYGERFADPAADRPAAPPRMPKGQGPTIPAGGTIPGAPHPLPDTMHHDPSTGRLYVGEGFIENVPTAVAEYQVSGRNVLRQWFSYRKADRTRPVIGDRRPPSALDKIQPDHWLPEYTEDLLNLLHVLSRLVALEPAQAATLDEICAAPLLTEASLTSAGALASAPVVKGKKAKAAAQPGFFD
ncbi:Methyltransferase domain-containing protein [Gemmobacter aquatilis]|uniref:site-specific DNA-methyltransferase (adenine-specific) n=1 Tax=Gemmobacter aquatilis TaxID=933059 RepID=A0A1H8NGQ4_9RHOB|nr:type ISP restriction/modification enzyme [Gemmobacter aquatilis]SEO28679.1 Methyltransferase domain-containing protein [Gemmobacter aquatilis]